MLHRDEVLAVRARELVDARDAAVAQDAGDLGLVDEHLDEVVVLGEVREHALDRDEVGLALRVEGLRAIDLRHSTERDAVEEVIAAELLSPSHRSHSAYHADARRPRSAMLADMSRALVLVLTLAGLAGCSGCSSHSAGSPEKDTGPAPGPEKIVVPTDRRCDGPHRAGGRRRRDDARFHLHPEEGSLTIDKCEGKAGAGITANVTVAPATGLHLATDYPIKITLDPTTGVTVPKLELEAGGRDKSQGDAQTLSEQKLVFAVTGTAAKAGAYELKGVFKFGVCDKESCHPKKQPITITVATRSSELHASAIACPTSPTW